MSTTLAQDHAQLDGQNTLNATLGPSSPTYFHLSTHEFRQWTNNFDGLDASVSTLTLDQLAGGGQQEDDMQLTDVVNSRGWTVGECLQAARQQTDELEPLVKALTAKVDALTKTVAALAAKVQ